jgi:hypothetical protein
MRWYWEQEHRHRRFPLTPVKEATMATTMHHHHADTVEVPSRVYWAAGIGLILLAALVFFYSTTGASQTASLAPSLLDQPLFPPVVPFLPLL